MNAELHRTSRVYISLMYNNTRWWLKSAENARSNTGRLFLRGNWSPNPGDARSFSFEIATVIRRRMTEQDVPNTQLSLEAVDLAKFLEE